MENVAFFARKKITMDKFTSQVKISAPSTINKVLNVAPKSVISSCDCVNGYVSLSGKIKLTMIYENQEHLVEHAEIIFDFIEKQQLNNSIEDIFVEDKLELKNITFSGTESICVVEHNICLNGNYKYEIPMITNDDNYIVTKNSSFNALKFITSCEDNFVVAEETEVNLSNIKILNSDANVILYETNCLVDRISVEGKIFSSIIYSDEQGVGVYSKEFEFKQEIIANNVVPNMILTALASVKNVTVTAEENETKQILLTPLTYT